MMWDEDDMTTQELTPRETARELRRLSGLVDKGNTYLFGNGASKGLDEVTRNIEDSLTRLEKRFEAHEQASIEKAKKEDENSTFYKRLIIGALVTNSLTILGVLLKIWILG